MAMCLHCNSSAGEGEHGQDAVMKFTYAPILPALGGGDGMKIRHSRPAPGIQIVQGQSRTPETLLAFNPSTQGAEEGRSQCI